MVFESINQAFHDVLGCRNIHESNMHAPSVLSESCIYKTDKGPFFVKIYNHTDIWMFEAEVKALELIEQTATLRVPKSYYYGKDETRCFLILEYLDLSFHSQESQRKLGDQLGKMHATKFARAFGFDMKNSLGLTPQINNWSQEWVPFFIENRLWFQLKLIEERYGDSELVAKGFKFCDKFPMFFKGIKVIPSLLHGDLWNGNTAQDDEGNPVVYDPASYYGHHEAELSILDMFGGFSHDFYDAYHKRVPKACGFEERQWGYKLYHYLNHYNLFGDTYRQSCLLLIEKII